MMTNNRTRTLVRVTSAVGSAVLFVICPMACLAYPATLVDAEKSVTVPFSPVLGKAMRLHSEKRITRVVGTVESVQEESTSDDELVFTERNKDGYVLRWTNTAGTIRTAPEKQAVMSQVLAASVGKSAFIQTDARGAPVALLNVAEMRSLIASDLDKMVAAFDTRFAGRPQAERDAIRRGIAGVAGVFRGMTDEQIGDLFLTDPKMLFGLGGAPLFRGRPVSFKTNMIVPIVAAAVAATETVTLQDVGPAELTISVTSSPDPKEVMSATAIFLEKMSAVVDASKQGAMKAVFDQLRDLTIADEVVLTIDARSGLPLRATHDKRVDSKAQSRVETGSYALAY